MILIITIFFVNVLFIGLAFGINKKNAKYLLAGYNTMSKEQQEIFDIGGFLKFFKKYFLHVAFYSTFIFLVFLLLLGPGVAIISYTLLIILPMPYLIIMGNRFNNN
tara:strand:+ start:46 stop:363 length:318 start_codon:yes stop_codon:yes gene_type:complete